MQEHDIHGKAYGSLGEKCQDVGTHVRIASYPNDIKMTFDRDDDLAWTQSSAIPTICAARWM
jgi:hypothetical protein